MKCPLLKILLPVLVVMIPAGAATPKSIPPFEELSGLIRSNLAGVTDAEIDRAAAQGLLSHFKGRVVLGNGKGATNGTSLVSRPTVYEGAFAYVRVARVENGAAAKVAAAFAKLGAKKQLKGLVLDLRYASGADYAAAGQVADLFLSTEQLLIDWGGGAARSTTKQSALMLPAAVLINAQTRGAAEALAAALRQAGAALLVGAHTAGEAGMFKEFTLANGQTVRLAAGNVKLGNGETLSTKGVLPDIAVPVGAEEERAYFADAYKLLGLSQVAAAAVGASKESTLTNNQSRFRINEAELVRLQREGNLPDEDAPLPVLPDKTVAGKPALDKSVVRDPALARALDLLKAIAIVQPARAP
jgi:hypothetical protein